VVFLDRDILYQRLPLLLISPPSPPPSPHHTPSVWTPPQQGIKEKEKEEFNAP
jgi:hypothetical protein